jgi:hypothetical protein
MKKTVILPLLSLLMVSMLSLTAQDKTPLALDIAKAQELNRAKLMNYSWQRSSKSFVNDEEKTHSLVKIWFNTEGKMESSVLSSTSTAKKKPGMRGRMQQSAGEDMKKLIEHSINTSIKYVYLSKGNWIDLLDKPGVKVENGLVKIDTKDLLQNGDEVHYVIDETTKLFKSINITSEVDGETFTSSIDFKAMSDGTNHPSRTVITIPSESLKITAENIDYIKQQ